MDNTIFGWLGEVDDRLLFCFLIRYARYTDAISRAPQAVKSS
ncbi:hypothetical protein CAter282_1368 [Collimonas arenae]|uniref:Uncharacterized protein n=1 Tax=Collimonas arenae TaxID=279058 RepID=A0A127QGG6_9BURK|nr:hypothetical protein CAter282_1368 [Collimonas arenae]